jgi:thioredoxin 1
MALALAVLGVLIARNAGKRPVAGGTAAVVETTVPSAPRPRLVDLGATQCIPCKRMAPILEELKKTYAGTMDVQFIDVWENPDAGKQYGVRKIPTQIFYDAAGKELFRHEGFLGRDDILKKWKELGVDLTGAAAAPGVSRWTPAQPDTLVQEAVC